MESARRARPGLPPAGRRRLPGADRPGAWALAQLRRALAGRDPGRPDRAGRRALAGAHPDARADALTDRRSSIKRMEDRTSDSVHHRSPLFEGRGLARAGGPPQIPTPESVSERLSLPIRDLKSDQVVL